MYSSKTMSTVNVRFYNARQSCYIPSTVNTLLPIWTNNFFFGGLFRCLDLVCVAVISLKETILDSRNVYSDTSSHFFTHMQHDALIIIWNVYGQSDKFWADMVHVHKIIIKIMFSSAKIKCKCILIGYGSNNFKKNRTKMEIFGCFVKLQIIHKLIDNFL